MKRYRSYKDCGIGWIREIPDEWRIKKLKYVTRTIIDGTHFTPTYVDTGIPFLRVTDIQTRNIDLDSVKYISEEEHKELIMRCNPEKNDLLLSKNGTIGITKVIDWDFSFSIFVSLCLIKFLKHLINPYFFSYFFQSNVVDEQIYGSSKTTSVTNLHLDKIRELLTLIPPLHEQQTIANYLDRKTHQIDTLIEKKQKLIALLKEQRTAIINQAVTKGLNLNVKLKDSGIEWLGEIPEHWDVKKLKWVVKERLKYGANESAELDDKKLPRYIRITDFDEDGRLRAETFRSLPFEKAEEYLLKEGDILFARSGATVGKTFQFKNYEGVACFAGYLIKATVNEKVILSDYLYLYTKSNRYENWKNRIFIQATIQNIGADKYQMLEVTIPPLNEQKNILNYVHEKSKKIQRIYNKTVKQIDHLKEYRTALISEVVTGKIDVRDSGEQEVISS